ncbi:amidase family protein [Paracoccus aurantiacus]|uniref:allophanate hydrolase-related protein n=1 Tax=Paracoccus aurantiacus TaxID=2599412 RepID=UPI001FEAD0C4|nr:amidase family protein [Paracoccus aurantiacus]
MRKIIEGAEGISAVDAFRGQYELGRLRQKTADTWQDVDMLLLPTSPTTSTVSAMLADPIRQNSKFGRYTNFANLMGCAAIAVPAGFGRDGLPAGVMLVAPGFTDDALEDFAAKMHADAASGLGRDRTAAIPAPPAPHVPEGWVTLAVVGAHLRGMPLNHQLTEPGGIFLQETRTAPDYRLFALADTVPPKPGLVRAEDGDSIAVELWALPPDAFGLFVDAIPAPLGIGKLTLEDGRQVAGFLCETAALSGAEDITRHGGWRNYLDAKDGV